MLPPPNHCRINHICSTLTEYSAIKLKRSSEAQLVDELVVSTAALMCQCQFASFQGTAQYKMHAESVSPLTEA